MSNVKLFKRYIELAEMLGKMFPNMLEVIMHDFSDLDHSIIFMMNGQLSGRKVGDGATELGLRRLLGGEDIPDMLVNYRNRNSQGNYFKSASLAIRDDKGDMIGAFCLNFDLSLFDHFRHFLTTFTQCEEHVLGGAEELTAATSLEEEIDHHIQTYLSQHHLHLTQLTYSDKQKIVAYLDQKRCFRQKGAMIAVAKALRLTRQSIYNYVKQSTKEIESC